VNPSEEKASLRERYRRERKAAFVPRDFLHILSAPEFTVARVVASYISIEFEPVTQALNKEILTLGKTLILPRITSAKKFGGNGAAMDWIAWNGASENLKKNKNLFEPIGDPWQSISEIDIVITPALRVDGDGYRLGQGGGYYDRALGEISGWKIALVHSGELTSEKLPRERHDQQVSAAATPDLLVRFR
jgi:5-formyltetrahydrofolate cyclo-ligase